MPSHRRSGLEQVLADFTLRSAIHPDHRRDMSTEPAFFVTRLRCECGLPGCRETFPAVAESFRGTAERFIVAPAHLGALVNPANLGDATVVRVSDRFFVVETDRSAGRFPAPGERRLRLVVDPDAMLESPTG
jgi:hypothetical protein